jgi:hypothetical protein
MLFIRTKKLELITAFWELESHNVSHRDRNQQLSIILHNKSEQLI